MSPYAARGQEAWPQRTITIIVPFLAGGSADLVARIFAQHFQEAETNLAPNFLRKHKGAFAQLCKEIKRQRLIADGQHHVRRETSAAQAHVPPHAPRRPRKRDPVPGTGRWPGRGRASQ